MFKKGDIVYHDNLIFADNCKDIKKDRPCIVFGEFKINEESRICTCPLTSSIKSFNKNPEKYTLITKPIYSERKLSFAKLDNILINKVENTHHTGLMLDENSVDKIIGKIIDINLNSNEEREQILSMIYYYLGLFDGIEFIRKDKKPEDVKIKIK